MVEQKANLKVRIRYN